MAQAAIGMVVGQPAGCATNRPDSWHQEAFALGERFHPTGAAREVGDQLYIQGVR